MSSHGKYFLIKTSKKETSNKDYMMAGSGCQPARINSRKEIECGLHASNCFEWEVVVNTNLECREKVNMIISDKNRYL